MSHLKEGWVALSHRRNLSMVTFLHRNDSICFGDEDRLWLFEKRERERLCFGDAEVVGEVVSTVLNRTV